jgi:ABC-type multidrug transport system permease subunit
MNVDREGNLFMELDECPWAEGRSENNAVVNRLLIAVNYSYELTYHKYGVFIFYVVLTLVVF